MKLHLPWHYIPKNLAAPKGMIADANDDYVCSFGETCRIVGYTQRERQARANFIVRACNSHDDLVAILKRLQIQIDHANRLQHSGQEVGPYIWTDLYETTNIAKVLLTCIKDSAI